MTRERPSRRSWMSGMGAAAAGLALGSAPLRAQAAGTFQPARHALDEWFDNVPGKHRVILDATTANGAGEAIAFATNLYAANRSGYQLENADLAVVLCLRHFASAFAFDNTMWAKYGAALVTASEYRNANAGEPPKVNPHNNGRRPELDGLAGRGAHFAICALATRFFATSIAGAGGDVDAVFNELVANAIPNAHFMPAGVVAVTRAQEYGYSLIYVG